jgi:hypothetical protein
MNRRHVVAAVVAPLAVPVVHLAIDLLGYARQSPAHLAKSVDIVTSYTLPASYVVSLVFGMPLLLALIRRGRPNLPLVAASWIGGWTVVGCVGALLNPGPSGVMDWMGAIAVGAVFGALGCVETVAFVAAAGLWPEMSAEHA